jgi:hypothetical protein
MIEYEHTFTTQLSELDFGRMVYAVAYLPTELIQRLLFPKSKRLRIDGEVNGVRINAGLLPDGGRYYLLISKKLQKQCGVTKGGTVNVAFNIADSDAVDVPRELEFALQADDSAKRAWENLTAGKMRGHCYRIESAKRIETKQRRIEEILEELRGL